MELTLFSLYLIIIISVNSQSTTSNIISQSRNFSVDLNEIVQLPCLVQQTDSSIVIWQQCEDSNCNELRTPVTIGKENFIQDLRFRLLSEDVENNNESENGQIVVNNWMLEIRRFSKSDEACYECQLNKFKANKIHYCLKVKPKLTITSKPELAKLNHQLKLECFIEEIVNFEKLRWYKNGVKLHAHNHHQTNLIIEKRHSNDYTFTFLVIKNFRKSDEGVYTCKYEHISNETINVYLNDGMQKAASLDSSQYELSSKSCTHSYTLNYIIIALLLISCIH